MHTTISQFLDACHPFGYPLLVCSIVLLAAIFYHLFFTGSQRFLRKLAPNLQRMEDGVASAENALREQCMCASHPLADDVIFVLQNQASPELSPRTEARLRMRVDAERAGMATISLITNIAPMLGILGTAWGLVDIFGVFGTPEAQQGIAMGISKALYTTIFGLAIAVPGVIAQTCFERGLERRAAYTNEFFTRLLALVHKA